MTHHRYQLNNEPQPNPDPNPNPKPNPNPCDCGPGHGPDQMASIMASFKGFGAKEKSVQEQIRTDFANKQRYG